MQFKENLIFLLLPEDEVKFCECFVKRSLLSNYLLAQDRE